MSAKGTASKIWSALGHASTLHWIFGLFVSSTVTSRAMSLMPGGWHDPQYWTLASSWFFGSLTAALMTTKGAEWGWRRWFAIRTSVEVYGGENVSMVVTNIGVLPVKYLASGQLQPKSQVPFDRLRPFQLPIWHGHLFKPNETTHGVLMEVVGETRQYDPHVWLCGDNATNRPVQTWTGRAIDKKWIRFSVAIQTEPPMAKPIERVYECRIVSTQRTRTDKWSFEIREITPSISRTGVPPHEPTV